MGGKGPGSRLPKLWLSAPSFRKFGLACTFPPGGGPGGSKLEGDRVRRRGGTPPGPSLQGGMCSPTGRAEGRTVNRRLWGRSGRVVGWYVGPWEGFPPARPPCGGEGPPPPCGGDEISASGHFAHWGSMVGSFPPLAFLSGSGRGFLEQGLVCALVEFGGRKTPRKSGRGFEWVSGGRKTGAVLPPRYELVGGESAFGPKCARDCKVGLRTGGRKRSRPEGLGVVFRGGRVDFQEPEGLGAALGDWVGPLGPGDAVVRETPGVGDGTPKRFLVGGERGGGDGGGTEGKGRAHGGKKRASPSGLTAPRRGREQPPTTSADGAAVRGGKKKKQPPASRRRVDRFREPNPGDEKRGLATETHPTNCPPAFTPRACRDRTKKPQLSSGRWWRCGLPRGVGRGFQSLTGGFSTPAQGGGGPFSQDNPCGTRTGATSGFRFKKPRATGPAQKNSLVFIPRGKNFRFKGFGAFSQGYWGPREYTGGAGVTAEVAAKGRRHKSGAKSRSVPSLTPEKNQNAGGGNRGPGRGENPPPITGWEHHRPPGGTPPNKTAC